MKELKSYNRRTFIQKAAALGAVAAFGSIPSFVQAREDEIKLTILHTNDVHSRIEPFPMDGGRNQGLGGAARRSTLLQQIRQQERNVLLFDAGDIFQGTPYFNMFDGELELELMSKMGYDAGTFGNHEFDNGLEGLLKHFDKAQFPFVTSNYDFRGTAMEGKTKDFVILERQGVKIGVFGIGIELDGMVDPNNHAGVGYHDPIETAKKMTDILKRRKKCDFVVCLSHIGYQYSTDQVSDMVLAANTQDIDLIIGGHTHTFLDKPTEVRNLTGEITLVNQTGVGGVNLGRLDFYFNKQKSTKRYQAHTYKIDHRYDNKEVMA